MTLVIFLIVLAVLIFVHELGHFLAAKAFGIRVDAFKIGFGPRILAWKGMSKRLLKDQETEYGLNLIPFGGYVKIFGENPDQESESGPDAGRSFVNKKRWQQAVVLAAGVVFNFIFAWALYVGVFVSGVTATTDGFERYADDFRDERIMVADVSEASPADVAGLKMGDVITGVADERRGLSLYKADLSIGDIQSFINESGQNAVDIAYERNGESRFAKVVPVGGIIEGRYAVGVAMADVVDLKLSIADSLVVGTKYTWLMTRETVVGLGALVTGIFLGTADLSAVSGPVGIAGIVGGAAEAGFTYLVMITALISVNLGVINLIPFPALDGGRILFVAIEGLIRRRIPSGFANAVNMVGFALLMLLMVLVTWQDVAKLY